MTDPRDTMRWIWRGVALAVLVIGWLFIAWQNHFHITAPMVFVCLGFLAVIATIYNLWRTGAAAVDSSEEGADSTWAKPAGGRGGRGGAGSTRPPARQEETSAHTTGQRAPRGA